jgi:alkylation response protein AidB-like acyl-CoA dehydrogenase
VRAFIADKVPARLAAKVREGKHLSKADMEEWHAILHARGWLASHWPKEYGGTGWSAVQKFIFDNECALANTPRIVPFGLSMLGPVLIKYGNEAQKHHWLPRILNGADWWAQGYSEPGAGSDLAGLKTTAVRGTDDKGDHYVVNGQKTWTTLGQHANMIFCLVRTNPKAKKQEGISFLLVDMKSPGVEVRPIITLDGEHEVNEVFFTDVRVPAENLVGEEDKGWTYAKYLLSHERTNIADVNRAKRELERLKRIAKAEGVYDDTRFRDEIAKLEVEVVALEMMVLRVLSGEKSGKQSLDVAGLLKIRGSELQQRYTELMMLAAGPYARPFVHEAMEAGWQGDHVGAAYLAPLAGTYFNYRKTTIYGGSNEVQRNIVSQTVLGA